jgi:protein-S-isoprenylcysteine O-methyltransferase Ste14
MGDSLGRALAFVAILILSGVLWFFTLWTWFDFWRRHRNLAYTVLALCFVLVGTLAVTLKRWSFGGRISMPAWMVAIGWTMMAAASVLAFVADRQIGFRVRSFLPFFEHHGHIDLKTTRAYAVVRHPIYTAAWVINLSIFLISGYPSSLFASVVFGLGAIWFTRREEARLMELLDDPSEYVRYRERVPALFPLPRRSSA